jgi:LysM repeat protein
VTASGSATGATSGSATAAIGTATAAPKPAKPEPVYHKIKSGDTLLALAMDYDTTVAEICALNGITRTTTLRLGRNLRIK